MLRDHFNNLQEAVGKTLTEDRSKGALACYKTCLKQTQEAIERVCEELAGEPFGSQKEEIWFYKEEAPLIWGLYLYYRRLVKLEALRKVRSAERFRQLIQRQLNRAELYPEKHEVCEYYYLGREDADEFYFSRRATPANMGMFLDRDMTEGTYRLAWMRAYEWLREWLAEEIAVNAGSNAKQRGELTASLTKMEAVELLKSLHVLGVFGNWPFAKVVSWAGEAMGVDVVNYSRLLQDLQRRKGNPTSYLDRLRDGLATYINDKL